MDPVLQFSHEGGRRQHALTCGEAACRLSRSSRASSRPANQQCINRHNAEASREWVLSAVRFGPPEGPAQATVINLFFENVMRPACALFKGCDLLAPSFAVERSHGLLCRLVSTLDRPSLPTSGLPRWHRFDR